MECVLWTRHHFFLYFFLGIDQIIFTYLYNAHWLLKKPKIHNDDDDDNEIPGYFFVVVVVVAFVMILFLVFFIFCLLLLVEIVFEWCWPNYGQYMTTINSDKWKKSKRKIQCLYFFFVENISIYRIFFLLRFDDDDVVVVVRELRNFFIIIFFHLTKYWLMKFNQFPM